MGLRRGFCIIGSRNISGWWCWVVDSVGDVMLAGEWSVSIGTGIKDYFLLGLIDIVGNVIICYKWVPAEVN